MRVDGVILAAGRSSRMGANKLTLDLAGRTVIERALACLMPYCRTVYVITRPGTSGLEPLFAANPRIIPVENPMPDRGMLSSIKTGLSAVKADQALILPGDCPLVKPSTCARLLAAEADIVVPVYHGESGHPVLIGKRMISALLHSCSGSLRDFIVGQDCTRIEVHDPGILVDVDTPEDLAFLREMAMPPDTSGTAIRRWC